MVSDKIVARLNLTADLHYALIHICLPLLPLHKLSAVSDVFFPQIRVRPNICFDLFPLNGWARWVPLKMAG